MNTIEFLAGLAGITNIVLVALPIVVSIFWMVSNGQFWEGFLLIFLAFPAAIWAAIAAGQGVSGYYLLGSMPTMIYGLETTYPAVETLSIISLVWFAAAVITIVVGIKKGRTRLGTVLAYLVPILSLGFIPTIKSADQLKEEEEEKKRRYAEIAKKNKARKVKELQEKADALSKVTNITFKKGDTVTWKQGMTDGKMSAFSTPFIVMRDTKQGDTKVMCGCTEGNNEDLQVEQIDINRLQKYTS